MSSHDEVVLSGSDKQQLRRLVRAGSTEQRLVVRARIVLLAGQGWPTQVIAKRLGVDANTARKWRHRWGAAPQLACLADAARSGRPSPFSPLQVAQVKALACTPPADCGLPLSRWSCPELAHQAAVAGICSKIAASTVRRWLSEDALKPWQYQSWVFIRDPNFAAKASRVLDLYARTWDGKPLGPNDYVISSDEKTSIQARCRCHQSLPPGKARMIRVNHEYRRRGAVAYLAAYDVHQAQVFGRCEDTTGIAPFAALVSQVMAQEPYNSADRVFWVVDNGSSHRGRRAIDRITEQFPNAIMVHTPVHASWLNQIEIYFSVVQRKVVSPNDFTDLEVVTQRLADFETHYNRAAKPFKWKFTTTDLDDLLQRLERRTNDPASPSQPRAA